MKLPMSDQLTLLAVLTAIPGQEDELGRRLGALVAPSRAEEGCLNYDLHRSNDDSAVWMLYENWRSRADLDEHLRKPYLVSFLADQREVLAREIDISQYSMTSEVDAKFASVA